ncbi:MAG TPA: nitrite reductase small subunit NirD [Myxococcales bacterium]|nr:nitrite reductase small subunit NirD [Myxococcales bacterium]
MTVALKLVVPEWEDACGLDEIAPQTGVCALVAGRQVAIVRHGDAVYALGNFDPFGKAFVLSRGIVGDRGGVPKIASPLYKQSFDLRTGACLDDPGVSVPSYEVRVERGRVLVRSQPRGATHGA